MSEIEQVHALLEATKVFDEAHTYFDIPDDTIVMMDDANHLYITAGDIRAIKAARSAAKTAPPDTRKE